VEVYPLHRYPGLCTRRPPNPREGFWAEPRRLQPAAGPGYAHLFDGETPQHRLWPCAFGPTSPHCPGIVCALQVRVLALKDLCFSSSYRSASNASPPTHSHACTYPLVRGGGSHLMVGLS